MNAEKLGSSALEPKDYWAEKALAMEKKASKKWLLLATRVGLSAICIFGVIGTSTALASGSSFLFLASLPCFSAAFTLSCGWTAAKLGMGWAKMMMHDLDFYIFPEKIAAQYAAKALRSCAADADVTPFKKIQHLCPVIDYQKNFLQLCVKAEDMELFKQFQHLWQEIDLSKLFDYGHRNYESFLANGYAESRFGKLSKKAREAIDRLIQEGGLRSETEIMKFIYENETELDQIEKGRTILFKGESQINPEVRIKDFVRKRSFGYNSRHIGIPLISKEIILQMIDSIGDQCQKFRLPSTVNDLDFHIALDKKGFRQKFKHPWRFIRL